MTPLFNPFRVYAKAIVAGLLLAILVVRCGCRSCSVTSETPRPVDATDTILLHAARVDRMMAQPRKAVVLTNADGTPVKNRVRGVGDCKTAFPDMNDVQLPTAMRLGVSSLADRDDAHNHQGKWVYIDDNPLYHVQRLSHSIPYLVPRAQRLLNEIARSFTDSLQRKGLPFYKLIVTSATRTEKDVTRLRRVNVNASENSCHRFGTTFDICYNSYYRVFDPEDGSKRQVWDGRLKDVLAEVLRDLRERGYCYVRYEYRQSCFHITAR